MNRVVNLTTYQQNAYRQASYEIEQACMFATIAERMGKLPGDFKLPEFNAATIQVMHGLRPMGDNSTPDLWANTKDFFAGYAARSVVVMMLASCDVFLQRLYWLRVAGEAYAAKGTAIKGEEFNDFGHAAAKIGRKGNRALIEAIVKGYPDLRSKFSEEYLSLCKIRNCLLHRMGAVSPEDTSEEIPLKAQWRRVAFEIDGKEVTEKPFIVPANAQIGMPVRRVVRQWKVGENIAFDGKDCQDIGFTLMTFCGEMGDKLQAVVRQIPGLPKISAPAV